MRFKLPELGEGVHEGELVAWKVKVGDRVKHDQILCEIMTDKATVEFPAPFDGKITEILGKEGQMIKVGQDILGYESEAGSAKSETGGALPLSAPQPSPALSQAQGRAQSHTTTQATSLGTQVPLLQVSSAPSTRKFAREMGVDLSQVQASGPGGRVMHSDIVKFLNSGVGAVAAGPAQPVRAPSTPEQRVPFRGLRKKIAEKMRLSKDKAAHFTYVEEADVSGLVMLRQQVKAIGLAKGIKVTYLPFVMKAMVEALKKFPALNSSLDEEKLEIVYKNYYNIGLSIQTDEGLMAPVIKHVENLSIFQLAKAIQDLVERARKKSLKLEDFQGGTITLTNAGSIGGLFATPVINYPEVAILGFNKIFRKPVVKTIHGREEIVIADWTYFSLSLDHRIVDGAIGAEFMKEMIKYIEAPSLLFLENL